jgi:hypothetical protein
LRLILEEFAIPDLQRYAIYGAVSLLGGSAWEECKRLRESGEHRVLKRLPEKPTTKWVEWKLMPDVFGQE